MKAVELNLGTHVDNGLMYRVYQNQDQGSITLAVTSFDRFYNLSLMKNFRHTFLKNCKDYNVETWYTYGQWADVLCILESGPWAHNFWS